MTIFEWAMYNFAARRMTPDEMATAKSLAELADRGNENARIQVRNLALKVIARTPREDKRSAHLEAKDG